MRIIRPSPPFGYTIFCDDIREEIDGKTTLVGVYGPEMLVRGTLPVVLPKLALSVNYAESLGESEEPLELRVYMPGDADDAPTLRAPIPASMREKFKDLTAPPNEDGESLAMLNLRLAFSPIGLKQEGALRIRMIRGDAEIRLGSLRIKAQPTPSEQTG